MSDDKINNNRMRANLWYDAESKKTGLTVGELRVVLTEAMRADIPDNAVIRVNVGFGGQIHRIEIKG